MTNKQYIYIYNNCIYWIELNPGVLRQARGPLSIDSKGACLIRLLLKCSSGVVKALEEDPLFIALAPSFKTVLAPLPFTTSSPKIFGRAPLVPPQTLSSQPKLEPCVTSLNKVDRWWSLLNTKQSFSNSYYLATTNANELKPLIL
jgi:hypothetical protein